MAFAASRLAEEFNAEASRAVMSLTPSSHFSISELRSHYGERYLQWTTTAGYPQIVRNVFIAENLGPGKVSLLRFDMNSYRLNGADWPTDLQDVKERLSIEPADGGAAETSPEGYGPDNLFLSRETPTAVVPLFQLGRPIPASPSAPPAVEQPPAWLIVEFSLECIVEEIFPELIDRYFSVLGEDEYRVGVWARSNPRRMIYGWDPSVTVSDLASADATADLFGLRPDRLPAAIVSSAPGRDNREPSFAVPPLTGRWQISVEHRLGSLDAAVDRWRYRNLATSLGILLVLAGGMVMIVAASERARVLEKQQIRFAAGVSHELHTPLAAIQALAHNLKTGVVRDPAQIEQYARMMLDETRGLSAMVDQVLLFAETQSKVKRYDVEPVEVTEVLNRALAGLASQIRESRCQVITEVPDDVPLLRSNIHALTHCVRNLVNNALKHGKSWSPSTIHIKVRPIPRDGEVQIQIIDSGPGIDPEDLPHIFEAFYRGEKAGAETRGAGLGLYLVKHLMEAQGGTVTVQTEFGAGSTFTLHTPVFPRFIQEPRTID